MIEGSHFSFPIINRKRDYFSNVNKGYPRGIVETWDEDFGKKYFGDKHFDLKCCKGIYILMRRG